ncbi:hypothetical protein ACFSUJ_34765 [Streptomyces lusitanus]|uniref:hypothetical protein n=1 Tax=Streptomyces lusitanus TaxID=68232 RepID=UPI0036256C6F
MVDKGRGEESGELAGTAAPAQARPSGRREIVEDEAAEDEIGEDGRPVAGRRDGGEEAPRARRSTAPQSSPER